MKFRLWESIHMASIYDLKEKDDEELLSEIVVTLSNFPILKEIYDEGFCLNLVKKRFHYDNYLLWLLVSRSPFATLTWESINRCLNLLKDADSIPHFRDKLRHKNNIVFHSYQTELELAGYYKERSYEVELEPPISKTNKNPDFRVEKDEIRVFFEVGNLFIEELIEMEKLDTQIHGRFGNIKEHFVFSISYKPLVLKMKHLKPLQTFLQKKLVELDKGEEPSFPLSLFFPDKKNTLAEVKVWRRPKKLKHGYLAGLLSGAFGLPHGGINIRRKISKKISQLPKGEANVIVVELGHLLYNEEDVLDALFGDEGLVVNKEDFSTHVVRGKERIFDAKKNTRLSAVLYYKKKYREPNFQVWRTVFHNPYASNPISPDFFRDENVKQLVLINEKEVYHMRWMDN